MPDNDLDDIFGDTLSSSTEAEPTETNSPKLSGPYAIDLWKLDGVRYVFLRRTCTTCGSVSVCPEGIYTHETHAKSHAEHLERVNVSQASFASLPREVFYLDGESPFCEACLNV